jgi:hypothetical protein
MRSHFKQGRPLLSKVMSYEVFDTDLHSLLMNSFLNKPEKETVKLEYEDDNYRKRMSRKAGVDSVGMGHTIISPGVLLVSSFDSCKCKSSWSLSRWCNS